MYNLNMDFSRIENFAEADALLTKHGGRLTKRKSSVKSLRELNADDKAGVYRLLDRPMPEGVAAMRHLAFRLYDTDVVTYREDGAVIITRYPSKTTNAFADQLKPRHLNIHFAVDSHRSWRSLEETTNPWRHDVVMCYDVSAPTDGAKWWSSDQRRVYRMRRSCAVFVQDERGSFYPEAESDIDPWMVPTLDKRKAHRALKAADYHAFMDWARATAMLTYTRASYKHGDHPDYPDEIMLRCLADQKRWSELLSDANYWPVEPEGGPGFADFAVHRFTKAVEVDRRGFLVRSHMEALGRALRGAVYRMSPGTLQVVPTPALASMRHVEACLKSRRYYGVPSEE